jgi:hypothetical protein
MQDTAAVSGNESILIRIKCLGGYNRTSGKGMNENGTARMIIRGRGLKSCFVIL